MIKENRNANIHLMSGNTKIVWLKIFDIDYPVVTIQFLLRKIDKYGNNKPSLNKMANLGLFLQNSTNTLSSGQMLIKRQPRWNNSLF